MYQERLFETWEKGLVYLLVVIALPIIPAIVYIVYNTSNDAYLYVLLITVIISLLYEFMNNKSKKCSTMVKIEVFVTCFALCVMLVWALTLLFCGFENNFNDQNGNSVYCLVAVFVVPVGVVVIEIVRCARNDIKSNNFKPSSKNSLKGAFEV